MEIVTKLITAIGSIVTVIGLFNVLMGVYTWYRGFKNENAEKIDQGINSMVLGGVIGTIAAGVTVAINAALGNISF